MSLKAVVGQRMFKLFPKSVPIFEPFLNVVFSVCCLGIMQDVIRAVQKPGEWKASCCAFSLVNVMFTFDFVPS